MKNLKHIIPVAVLIAILTAGVGFGLQVAMQKGMLLPQGASRQAIPIDRLFGLHLWAIAFLFSLIVGFMIYSIVVFRRRKGETGDGDHIEGNATLEILWTIGPLALVVFFSYLGGQSLAEIERVDPDAMRVNVTGRQWSWTFEYPEFDITSDELVLPINKQALLRLRSQDVLHSFWVPEFRVKQDLLPGDQVRALRITPNREGDFKVRCAELCGREHANMLAPVVVLSSADFDAWVERKIAEDPTKSEDPVVRGRAWAEQNGCAACHSFDGSALVGPTWLGLFGREEILDDGSSVTADEAYILNSIRDPGSQIVEGFTNAMPANAGENLSDEQISDIIEFIKTLQ